MELFNHIWSDILILVIIIITIIMIMITTHLCDCDKLVSCFKSQLLFNASRSKSLSKSYLTNLAIIIRTMVDDYSDYDGGDYDKDNNHVDDDS